MNPFSSAELHALLAEDVGYGDLTTTSLGIAGQLGRMTFAARGPMVVAGLHVAAAILELAGADVTVASRDGAKVAGGALLLTASGPAGALHAGWKVAQTLMEIASGIASAARDVVDAVAVVDGRVRVACTRKTVPGARRLSLLAVRAGGAVPHRLGLSETILVFPEHRAFLADPSFAALSARLRHEAPEKKLVVEVASVREAHEALLADFDVIQLEKLTPEQVAEVSKAVPEGSRVLIAAAGGINPTNAGAYVEAGARLIVTSWPYTARPADVKVTLARR